MLPEPIWLLPLSTPTRVRTENFTFVGWRDPPFHHGGIGTHGEIRTLNLLVLSQAPLPIGLRAHGAGGGVRTLKQVVLSHPGIPVPVTSARVEPRGIEPLSSGCKPGMLVRYHQGPKVRAQGVEPCSSSLSAKCP